jgi:hypothetical protein
MAGSKKTSSSWQDGVADRPVAGERGLGASRGGTTAMTGPVNEAAAAVASFASAQLSVKSRAVVAPVSGRYA